MTGAAQGTVRSSDDDLPQQGVAPGDADHGQCPITPNSSAWLDAGLEALSTTSLTQDERIAASLLVTGPPVGTDPSFPATNSRDEPAG